MIRFYQRTIGNGPASNDDFVHIAGMLQRRIVRPLHRLLPSGVPLPQSRKAGDR